MSKGENYHNIYTTLGASNHSAYEREKNDFYVTPTIAGKMLLELEDFDKNIWEPACGINTLTNVFKEAGHTVKSSDIIDRLHDGTIEIIDFLKYDGVFDGDIITNPPYKYAQQFVEHAMQCITDGHKVAMYLKLQFLEGKARREMFKKYPPKTVYVSSSRLGCVLNGDFEKFGESPSGSVCFCWFVWEKGYTGTPQIKWFN